MLILCGKLDGSRFECKFFFISPPPLLSNMPHCSLTKWEEWSKRGQMTEGTAFKADGKVGMRKEGDFGGGTTSSFPGQNWEYK